MKRRILLMWGFMVLAISTALIGIRTEGSFLITFLFVSLYLKFWFEDIREYLRGN